MGESFLPSLANKESKTLRLVLIPKLDWETEIRAFKEICARNRIEVSNELYERAVKTFLRDHHWPPGNSQTILDNVSEDGSKIRTFDPIPCFFGCGRPSEKLASYGNDERRVKVCWVHADCIRHNSLKRNFQYQKWKIVGEIKP